MAQRFEGSIPLANLGFSSGEVGKAASAIVGRGGSGIKELTKTFPGLYIQVFDSRLGRDTKTKVSDCDMVYISGRSGDDVQGAAKAVAERARGVLNGTTKTGPSIEVGCPAKAVGAVIGRGGSGLKQMGETAGDYCHIHFNRDTDKFEITANTQVACDRAKLYIGQRIRDFLKPRVEKRPESRPRSNGFDGLTTDNEFNDHDESSDELEDLVQDSHQTVVKAAFDALSHGSERSNQSIASKTAAEVPQKIRWEIREELSKKVDPETGDKLYMPFHRKDRKTGLDQFVKGVHAVPWRAVDDFITERQTVQKMQHKEQLELRKKGEMERQTREHREAYMSSRESTEVFPTLGSKVTTKINGWGSKPTSISSSEGVEALNEAARKDRHPTLQKRKANIVSTSHMIDLTTSLPSAPTRQMVDLTSALLPTGPRHLDLCDVDRAYQEFLAGEEDWAYGVPEPFVEEDDWWQDDRY